MRTMLTRVLLALPFMALCAEPARASSDLTIYNTCFAAAAKRFGLDGDLLRAIAKHESSLRHDAVGKRNNNGTVDYGLMMINSSHLPLLLKAGYSKQDLFDPCTSIHIGAFILDDCVRKHGKTWRAVGCYNTGYRPKNDRLLDKTRLEYVRLVKRAYDKIKRARRLL